MQLRELLTDDDAVSPVIGVILMVAITVILAAVIATFVLGLGDSISNVAPTTSFSFDYDEGEVASDGGDDPLGANPTDGGRLSITHSGGDSVQANELYVRGTVNGNDDGPWDSGSTGTASFGSGSDVSAGQGIDVDVASDDVVRIIYEPQDAGQSAILERWPGPDA